MKKLLISSFFLFLCSCTYSITCVHTQGKASDVVDENQSASPKVDPTVNAPIQSPSSGQSVEKHVTDAKQVVPAP